MPSNEISSSKPLEPEREDEHYDTPTIWLHWLTASLVAFLWIIGQVTGWLPRGPFRSGVWSTHVVLGFLLSLVLAIRILWRVGPGKDLPPADGGVLNWLAKGTHYALYLLLLAVVVLGVANASYRGYSLYGVLTVPRFGTGDPATEDIINTCHEWAANLTVLVAFFHAAAAISHRYIWRDPVLQRMLPP